MASFRALATTDRKNQLSTPVITLFSKPACSQCFTTKLAFDKLGLVENEHYKIEDMSQKPQALERVRALGYMQAPVVEVAQPDGSTVHWSGMNPAKIKEHCNIAA